MADLIDRQAAIDVLGVFTQADALGHTPKQIVEALPSAQPETNCSEIPNSSTDCISRQAAIDCVTYDVEHTVECLKALPSAQPERKKGYWLRYGEDGYPNNEDTVFWQCDQCLEQYTGRTKRIPNFCPNCGADMRGKQNG